MIALLVYAGLSVVCIATAAVLHFAMPDSSMPAVILGAATVTLIPGVASAAKELRDREKARDEQAMLREQAELNWKHEQQRADKLFEETQTLRKDKNP